MKQGGTVIFDTRDALTRAPAARRRRKPYGCGSSRKVSTSRSWRSCRATMSITKTFYLLDSFVGRYDNGDTWVEALPPDPKEAGASRPVRAADSVSAVVITSNDLAAAWAQDKRGQPLYPLVPGGARQREMALRGGVNS